MRLAAPSRLVSSKGRPCCLRDGPADRPCACLSYSSGRASSIRSERFLRSRRTGFRDSAFSAPNLASQGSPLASRGYELKSGPGERAHRGCDGSGRGSLRYCTGISARGARLSRARSPPRRLPARSPTRCAPYATRPPRLPGCIKGHWCCA
jgi:hypothetical protein